MRVILREKSRISTIGKLGVLTILEHLIPMWSSNVKINFMHIKGFALILMKNSNSLVPFEQNLRCSIGWDITFYCQMFKSSWRDSIATGIFLTFLYLFFQKSKSVGAGGKTQINFLIPTTLEFELKWSIK